MYYGSALPPENGCTITLPLGATMALQCNVTAEVHAAVCAMQCNLMAEVATNLHCLQLLELSFHCTIT